MAVYVNDPIKQQELFARVKERKQAQLTPAGDLVKANRDNGP